MSGQWHVGDITITPVFEVEGDSVIEEGLVGATPETLLAIPWLRPHFVHDDGRPKAVVQSFIIETNGERVLVDPACGNDRTRNDIPEWSELRTDYFDRLPPIDIVVSTHMHFDHVGWTTRLADGQWVPSFPSAKHVWLRDEFDYWSSSPAAELADDRQCFADSVKPIVDAGLAEIVSIDHEIADGITFIATPGHTPGHASVLIESKGQRGIITGDAIHHPSQLAFPDWVTNFDADGAMARTSRRALLERVADTSTFLIGSHFSSPTAGYVRRDGDGFKLDLLDARP